MGFDQTLEIEQNGYLYIWLSNESKEARVWFDDLTITHEEQFVVQATDYGVWGDVIREQKSDIASYRYGYQGQFAEKDDETGWNHFELREYDAVVGRWTATDPYGQHWSPYLGMSNNPISGTDPDGGLDDVYSYTDGRPTHIIKTNDSFDRLYVDNEFVTFQSKGWGLSVFTDAIVWQNRDALRSAVFQRHIAEGIVRGYDFLINNTFGYIPGFGQAFSRTYNAFNALEEGNYVNAAVSLGVGKVGKVSKSLGASKKVKDMLPSLDVTGKVHGTLPKVKDFVKYSKDELRILLSELRQSVHRRIEVTSKMGRDRGHGQRQGAEQDLIKSLEKYLGG